MSGNYSRNALIKYNILLCLTLWFSYLFMPLHQETDTAMSPQLLVGSKAEVLVGEQRRFTKCLLTKLKLIHMF